MRVIITGGTGLIGRALMASLAADGHEVIILTRDPARATGLPPGARAERWDARSAAGWGTLANGADAIVNLAGENLAAGRWTPERKRRILDSRIQAGQAVVAAVRAAAVKPGVVVYSSGIGYYGASGDAEVTEASPPGRDFLAQVCVAWEAASAETAALGVRSVVVRSATVLSREGGALPRLMLPFRLFVGGPLGNGQQWWPWIHIADEVAAIRFLIERADAQGPFNLAAPQLVRQAEFSRALGRALGRPSWLPVPAFALRLLLGEMAAVLLDGQRAAPQRLLELGFAFRFPTIEAALRDLAAPR
jgi:uncharacterized protein (TIGR01777 family)